MDPVQGFDLSVASREALVDLQTPAAPESVQETPSAAPVVETPANETPAPAAASSADQVDTTTPPPAPPPAEEVATQTWEFTRKGQTVKVTDQTQALELIRKGYDYTEKTMELAEQKRQTEAQITQAREWLRNPVNVRSLLQTLEGTPPVPAPHTPDPEAFPTVAETQAAIAAQVRQAQATMQVEAQTLVQRALLDAETARYTQEYKAEVGKTMSLLTAEKYPILQDVEKIDRLILDDVSEVIRGKVAENPSHVATIDEVKDLMVQSAKRRADRLDARVKEHLKMAVVREAKLKEKGAEPAGGGTPPPAEDPTYKLGDARLTKSVIAELQAAFNRKG